MIFDLGRAAAILVTACIGVGGVAFAQGGPVSGQTWGDWRFDCRGISETVSRCRLTQTLLAGDRRQAIARIALAPGEETGLIVLSIQLPLGISIPAGVRATVDDGDEIALPVLRCVRSGCVAARSLVSAELAELREGSAMSLRFLGVSGAEVMLPVSLVGLTAGLDANDWGR